MPREHPATRQTKDAPSYQFVKTRFAGTARRGRFSNLPQAFRSHLGPHIPLWFGLGPPAD